MRTETLRSRRLRGSRSPAELLAEIRAKPAEALSRDDRRRLAALELELLEAPTPTDMACLPVHGKTTREQARRSQPVGSPVTDADA